MKTIRQVSVLVLFSVLVFGVSTAFAATATAPDLGTAGNFVVLSKAQITDVPSSVITGDVGASPITGASIHLSCSEVTGTIWQVNDAYTGGSNASTTCAVSGTANSNEGKTYVDTAILDMATAYNTAIDVTANPAGTGPFLNAGSPAGTLSGQTLVPGVYTWGTAVTITDDIYLDGSATDIWVFQISGTLNISSAKQVHLTGGAVPANVFWAVTGDVTLGTTSVFEGNILTTGTSHIAMLTGATLHGRALSDGEIWLQSTAVTATPATPPVIETCNDSSFDGFDLGSVNGQDGWSATGPYDQAIVDNTYGYTSFGCKSLRLSDSVTSGSFGDQTFAKPLIDAVGEASSTDGTFLRGTLQNHLEMQFDIASVLPTFTDRNARFCLS